MCSLMTAPGETLQTETEPKQSRREAQRATNQLTNRGNFHLGEIVRGCPNKLRT